ncbi:hypothetical protein ABZX12_07910 [Kribbella sp. NPDC003505]|uniref:hypothetical protein n=1 Tax=Kribbella sp. NPDC003505 TaxID=3154448 RepID=UPI0033BCE9AC
MEFKRRTRAGMKQGTHRATYDALVCARLLSHLATPPGRAPLALAELLDATVRKAATSQAADDAAATLF